MRFVIIAVLLAIAGLIVTSRSCDFTGKEELEGIIDQASNIKDTIDEHVVDCDDSADDEGGAGTFESPKAFRCPVAVDGWHARVTDVDYIPSTETTTVNVSFRQIDDGDYTQPLEVAPQLSLNSEQFSGDELIPGGVFTDSECSYENLAKIDEATDIVFCFSGKLNDSAGPLKLNDDWMSLSRSTER